MQQTCRHLLEGNAGAARTAARILLAPLGLLYGGIAALRAWAYRHGVFATHAASAPVISVGNLTAGGTGKTPFTIRLVQHLLQAGRRPAILTRGYGAADPDRADEVQLLRRLLPDVPVYAGADRVMLAQRACGDGANVLILDDGFQHQRLRRNLDIVLIDATCPWGGGLPLPAGLLREFRSAIRRAHVVALTHTPPDPDTPMIAALSAELKRLHPSAPLLFTRHVPTRLATLSGEVRPLAALHGQPVVALSAIGRPAAFTATLGELGADVGAIQGEFHRRLQKTQRVTCGKPLALNRMYDHRVAGCQAIDGVRQP